MNAPNAITLRWRWWKGHPRGNHSANGGPVRFWNSSGRAIGQTGICSPFGCGSEWCDLHTLSDLLFFKHLNLGRKEEWSNPPYMVWQISIHMFLESGADIVFQRCHTGSWTKSAFRWILSVVLIHPNAYIAVCHLSELWFTVTETGVFNDVQWDQLLKIHPFYFPTSPRMIKVVLTFVPRTV